MHVWCALQLQTRMAFFFWQKKHCNGIIGTECFTQTMEEVMPVKRVSIGTVLFGATVAKLELLQPVA
jgi:hypothetical protein